MTHKPVLDSLKGHPFFQGLEENYFSDLEECSTRADYPKDIYLLRTQMPANDFFVLLEGQVKLLNHVPGGKVAALETIAAPNIVGWSWLVSPYRWHFDVKTMTPVSTLRIHAPQILAKMALDKALAADLYQRFMALVVERLQAARMQSMDIYANPNPESTI